MTADQPKFGAPPVIETVLSVQFARLTGFSTAHAGWFWKSYLTLPGEWTKAIEAPRIEDQVERFGKEDTWGQPKLRFGRGGESQRMQFVSADEERMVQVQDSRLVLNWRKQSASYPSYKVLIPQFHAVLQAFQSFARDAQLGAPELTQWEVVYVNHIQRGDMWESLSDWPSIIPNLFVPRAESDRAKLTNDAMNADWRFLLNGERGRLYIALRHARIPPVNSEVMALTLTARGPVDSDKGLSVDSGLELGHDAIVRTFTAMMSSEAHKRWKRRA